MPLWRRIKTKSPEASIDISSQPSCDGCDYFAQPLVSRFWWLASEYRAWLHAIHNVDGVFAHNPNTRPDNWTHTPKCNSFLNSERYHDFG
jgi:hypothetical protein